jgi:hypothetical protein
MSKSTKRNRAPKGIDLRPFSAIARRHAQASSQIGTFHMSEGYELIRTCYSDKIHIAYNVAHQGSSFGAPVREESVVAGKVALEAIMADLIAEGYIVSWNSDALHGLRLEVIV